ncbi:MAG: metallophosphatase family protein [Acidobacteria bacterium]|nr:metallophosphatase family protein [Acidobacteriota bacterium]
MTVGLAGTIIPRREAPHPMDSFAVISDVHGNLEALEAVLAEVDRLGVRRILSLGDVVGYGPDPEACLRLVQARCSHRLLGNHEHAVLNPGMAFEFNPSAQAALEWTRERLRQADLLPALEGLLPHHQEGEYLFVHGSARNALEEYLRETDPEGRSTFEAVAASIEEDFTSFRICFVGHNHKPFLATAEGFLHPHAERATFQVPPEEKLYVSVGSVGQPRDLDPRACFVVFEGTRVDYHRVPYPWTATAAKIRAAGLPGRLAERLGLGR